MTDEPDGKLNLTKWEIEMVIRDKYGNVKSIDQEVSSGDGC